jgi:hypothetical protein
MATGIAGVVLLEAYLDVRPENIVARLLISDSTVHDTETGHGHFTFTRGLEADHPLDEEAVLDELLGRPKILRPPLTDEEEHRQLANHEVNGRNTLRLKRAIRDIEAPLTRVFDKIAQALQALTFLTYVLDPVHRNPRRVFVPGDPVDPRSAVG